MEEKPGVRRERPPRQVGDRDKANTRVFKDRVRSNENAVGEKRLFERKSGTGRNEKENKRGGGGKANWGKEGEEGKELAATAEKAPKDAAAPEDKVAVDAKKDGAADEATVADPDQPQQPPAKPTLGLEEYQAMKQKERQGLDQVLADFKKKDGKERNPSDEQNWDGFQVLKRDGEDKPQAPKKDKTGKKEKKAASVVLPVKFAATEDKSRKGGKGKGPEGGPKQRAPDTPDVSNKDAFPALRAPTAIATSS